MSYLVNSFLIDSLNSIDSCITLVFQHSFHDFLCVPFITSEELMNKHGIHNSCKGWLVNILQYSTIHITLKFIYLYKSRCNISESWYWIFSLVSRWTINAKIKNNLIFLKIRLATFQKLNSKCQFDLYELNFKIWCH